MRRFKSLIVYLCGLLMAAQGFAPVLAAPASHRSMAAHQTSHCASCPDHHDRSAPPCCDAQCPDSAGCANMPAIAPSAFAPMVTLAVQAQPAEQPADFAGPDPDTRLRPPTSFLS